MFRYSIIIVKLQIVIPWEFCVDSYYCLFDLHFKWPPSLLIYQSITITAIEQSDMYLQSLCLHVCHLIIMQQYLMNTLCIQRLKQESWTKFSGDTEIIWMIWLPLCSEQPDENGQTSDTVCEAAYSLLAFCEPICCCFSEDEMRPVEKKKQWRKRNEINLS